jgi:hypothetical protein
VRTDDAHLRFDKRHGSGWRRRLPCGRGTGFTYPQLPRAGLARDCVAQRGAFGRCERGAVFLATTRDPRDSVVSACFWKLLGLRPFKNTPRLPPPEQALLDRCVTAAYPKYAVWEAVRRGLLDPSRQSGVEILPYAAALEAPVEHAFRIARSLGFLRGPRHVQDAAGQPDLLAAIEATCGRGGDARFVPVTLGNSTAVSGSRKRNYTEYWLPADRIRWMDAASKRLGL